MLQNVTRQRLNVKKELRERKDPVLQGERTRDCIRHARGLTSFDRVKRLGLFDTRAFLDDPNGDGDSEFASGYYDPYVEELLRQVPTPDSVVLAPQMHLDPERWRQQKWTAYGSFENL